MPVLDAPPALAPRPALSPATDRRPVEQAVVRDALSGEPPETLVVTDIPQPDGLLVYPAWTDGGDVLGDRIDRTALARGVDGWSWIEILHRHVRTTHRGRITIRAYPLRRVLDDVERGYRGDETHRAALARLLADDAARDGRPPLPAPGNPSWVGVGPRLWHGHHHGAIGGQRGRRDAAPGSPVGQRG
ncbi:hypothetical protein OG226_00400 [Streptomyces sp. NBC_01261]|uniref:hypothetical protein n=1 Tax=Streptomyces sp. NBC_01261 TaxID=2903802 RepID=UPI002E341F10|nr:hypothetical protein [Streptomyces sp. NBC_01261]